MNKNFFGLTKAFLIKLIQEANWKLLLILLNMMIRKQRITKKEIG